MRTRSFKVIETHEDLFEAMKEASKGKKTDRRGKRFAARMPALTLGPRLDDDVEVFSQDSELDRTDKEHPSLWSTAEVIRFAFLQLGITIHFREFDDGLADSEEEDEEEYRPRKKFPRRGARQPSMSDES